jgi:adenine-specific DNA-methyltransferase
MFDIENRRYIGSKTALASWIFESIPAKYRGGSFFDVFAGTGIVAMKATDHFKSVILNDLLYSNEVIYKAFFGKGKIDKHLLTTLVALSDKAIHRDNYFSKHFGGKYFSVSDARKIGWLRGQIDDLIPDHDSRTRNVALASLIYSADRCANTVGHYEAFLRLQSGRSFKFELVRPNTVSAKIFRQDANDLVSKVVCDVAYLDPPYNSRQYSRFYHVLETLVKWDKPKLSGVALKPPTENSSRYSKVEAPEALRELVENIRAKLIVISYNNTYESKSSSSRNKIKLEEIKEICEQKGKVEILEMQHKFFNAGNTDFGNHKEFLFLVEVGK